MDNKMKKGLLTTAFLFGAMFFTLAFVPHRTCGCGQYEDGSYLTHVINSASETITGKPIIEKNPNPLKQPE